jgi:hypothetical protein
VGGIGDKPGLRACIGATFDTEIRNRHRYQCCGNPLSGGKEHIHFTIRRRRTDLIRKVDEIIRCVTHSGHDSHYRMAGHFGVHYVFGSPPNSCRVCDRRTAVLLHD